MHIYEKEGFFPSWKMCWINKDDQVINRIHNLNLIIFKNEKAFLPRANCLHLLKNNKIWLTIIYLLYLG